MRLMRALAVSGFARGLPMWSWNTLPTYIHFANQSGAFDSAAVKQLAKQAFVVFEKDQGRWPTEGQPQQGYPSSRERRPAAVNTAGRRHTPRWSEKV